ncbi:MAG: hypothetical protein ABJ239_11000 [Erythrobacter sp.]
MAPMIQFVEGNTIQRGQIGEVAIVRESPEVTLGGQIFGALLAAAFVAAAAFFWVMPVSQPESEILILRVLLCGGFVMIAALIVWSSLLPRKSVAQMEVDIKRQEFRLGKVTKDESFRTKHTMPFGTVKQFFAGSQTAPHERNSSGTTALYVQADSGPRNGAMLVGSVSEIELLAGELNAALQGHPMIESKNNTADLSGGFGKRGT